MLKSRRTRANTEKKLFFVCWILSAILSLSCNAAMWIRHEADLNSSMSFTLSEVLLYVVDWFLLLEVNIDFNFFIFHV